MKMKSQIMTAVLIAVTSLNVAEAEKIASGETLAHPCAGCHGTNGIIENEAFMPLAGMPADMFVQTMLDFRNDARQATLMGHVAKGFSEEEITRMGEFFAAVNVDDSAEVEELTEVLEASLPNDALQKEQAE